MSATGPFANILSERAALLGVVAGAVEMLAEEPDDELGLEEEVKPEVSGRELIAVSKVEVSVVEETVGSEVLEESLESVVGSLEGDVFESVATEVVGEVAGNEDGSVIGPGPKLNRINEIL